MPGLEEQAEGEQLYMLEVVLDKVGVREDKAAAGRDPVLPAMARITFCDFPVMEVERNQLLLVEGNSGAGGSSRVAGLPSDWAVEEWGEELTVTVGYMDWNTGDRESLVVTVPRAVLSTGEALRYVLAVARQRLPEDAFQAVQDQVAQQLEKDREAGPRSTQHTFSAGKSCLFHMAPSELVGSMAEHPIIVQVYRSSTEGSEFVHTLVGEAKVLMGMSFTKAVLLACTPGAIFPTTAHLDNTFPMSDNFERETGDLHLFVRLSCFGPAPFRQQETDEVVKKKFLKALIRKEQSPSRPGKLDMKYPWKKNLGIVADRPAPKPRLQPLFEREPEPPAPLPPFDFGQYLPEVPRCTPFTPPPCYRRAGDPPLSRCTKQMESQLRREELTKGAQTDPSPTQPQMSYNEGERNETLSASGSKGPDGCTCPTIPPELRPINQDDRPKLQCTCASIVKSIVSPQTMEPNQPAAPAMQRVNPPNTPKAQPLGESDYEITLTKTECGLEEKATEDKKKAENQVQKPNQNTTSPEKSNKNAPPEEAGKRKDAKPQKADVPEQSQPTGLQGNQISAPPAAPVTPLQPTQNPPPKSYPASEYSSDDLMSNSSNKVKRKSIYEPTPGMYPGHQYGHRRCVTRVRPVPKHMGWLWTAVTFDGLLKGRGWFPGMIRRDVNSVMNQMKDDTHGAAEALGAKPGMKFNRQRGRPLTSKAAETIKYNPNLHVHKKEGYYYISMMPVKTVSQEEAGVEPRAIEYKLDPKHPDDEDSYGDYSDDSSDVKSYEMNFIVPLALQKRKKKVENATLGVQYNEQDFMKKVQKKKLAKSEIVVQEKAPPETKETGKKCKKGKGKKK